jgi:predicted AAA+ superfamily ATPase
VELLRQQDDRKISFLIGARQVGKTTLLNALYEEICTNQKNKGIYLDLDIFSNFEKISTFENLLNLLKINGHDEKQKRFFYLFLDEVQRYGDLSIILKNAYDSLPNVKIYASGSSSIKIKSQIQESLAGRKKMNIIYPLDFEEFLWFKEDKEAILQFGNIHRMSGTNLNKQTPKLNGHLNEFMVFGGYPEAALKAAPAEKVAVLESIFDLYIKKDLVEHLNIKKIMNAKKLIEHLAINNGQKTKYDEICQASQLEYAEARNYLEILKETHIISIIKPFFTNKNKELVKIPKIYFIDNGVRNFFINNFNPPHLREDKGFLLEGYAISELLKAGTKPETIKFWQDKSKHEVDIIIDDAWAKTPIEAKSKTELKSEDFIGMNAFMETYAAKKGYLINLGSQKESDGITLILPFDFCTQIRTA